MSSRLPQGWLRRRSHEPCYHLSRQGFDTMRNILKSGYGQLFSRGLTVHEKIDRNIDIIVTNLICIGCMLTIEVVVLVLKAFRL